MVPKFNGVIQNIIFTVLEREGEWTLKISDMELPTAAWRNIADDSTTDLRALRPEISPCRFMRIRIV